LLKASLEQKDSFVFMPFRPVNLVMKTVSDSIRSIGFVRLLSVVL
jgi:hypothetical protein